MKKPNHHTTPTLYSRRACGLENGVSTSFYASILPTTFSLLSLSLSPSSRYLSLSLNYYKANQLPPTNKEIKGASDTFHIYSAISSLFFPAVNSVPAFFYICFLRFFIFWVWKMEAKVLAAATSTVFGPCNSKPSSGFAPQKSDKNCSVRFQNSRDLRMCALTIRASSSATIGYQQLFILLFC